MGATDHNFFYSLMSPSKLFLKSWMSAFNGEGGYKSGEYTILESLPAHPTCPERCVSNEQAGYIKVLPPTSPTTVLRPTRDNYFDLK
jgi:hypothetical protein